MTLKGLPARAADTLRAVGEPSTCTLAIVEALKILLLPSEYNAVPLAREGDVMISRSQKAQSAANSSAPRRGKKKPQISIHEVAEEVQTTLRLEQRLALATEIANVTLKSLTSAAGAPKLAQTLAQKRSSFARSSSSHSRSSTTTSPKCQTPLQSISINRTISSPYRQSKAKCASSQSDPYTPGIRAQSECCRIAFACLRSIQTSKSLGGKFAALQLEKGMSALIAKLLAIGFEDLAFKELRILKRRLETLMYAEARTQKAAVVGVVETSRQVGAQEDSGSQRVSMASLLEYDVEALTGPLLDLVIVSQLQAFKIINVKAHRPTLEAALKHLQLDQDHAVANLIVRQIDPKNIKKNADALRQLEGFTQSLFRLCPYTSQAKEKMPDSPSHVPSETAFQYQSLAFKIRLIWWNLSGHQPNIDKELLGPFARCLTAFCRQCKLSDSVKYKLARDAYVHILENSQPWTQAKKGDTTAITQILSDLALRVGKSEEAMNWTRSALSNVTDTNSPPLRRLALSCQLATMKLNLAFADDERSLLDLLGNIISDLQGDLRGESDELDQTLVTVMGLRKSTFLKVRKDCKSFQPMHMLSTTSILGRCAHISLLSARFLARYLGHEPDQAASERQGSRYQQRKAMAVHVAIPTIESVIFFAQLMAKSGNDLWLIIDSFIQDCIDIAAIFEGKSLSTQDINNLHAQNATHPHVSLSEAYWYRYLCVKASKGEVENHIRLLQSSINVLMERPLHEKVAGALQMKLDRLASTFTKVQDHQRGLTTYKDIICSGAQLGILRRTASIGSQVSPFTTLTSDSNAEIFLRALQAYSKTATRLNLAGQQVSSYLDQEWMPVSERGLLLEQQFISIGSNLTSSSTLAMYRADINALALLILALYTPQRYPIRRQNFILRLSYLSLLHPKLWEEPILNMILASAYQNPLLVSGTDDEELQGYANHSSSCQRLYAVLTRMSHKEQTIQDIIAEWGSLVGTCPDLKLLKASVYDFEAWLQQLELLSDYLALQGLESWRTSVIEILVKVYEIVHPTQCAEVVVKLIDLGILYARLGYSSHSGVILLKVQKYVDSCDVSALTLIRWHLAKAEYALASGDYNQR